MPLTVWQLLIPIYELCRFSPVGVISSATRSCVRWRDQLPFLMMSRSFSPVIFWRPASMELRLWINWQACYELQTDLGSQTILRLNLDMH